MSPIHQVLLDNPPSFKCLKWYIQQGGITAMIRQQQFWRGEVMQGKIVNQFMNEKAGMASIDKATIAETIERMTAGTPKALHEKEMQQKRELEVAEMLRKCLSYSEAQKAQIKKEWWGEINKMRTERPLNRYWAHLDFDMFYIACELLDKPEFKDLPCAVGGPNSVLATANYEARKYGLRAAMPTFIALELCPQVKLFPGDFPKYRKYSNIFRQILSQYDADLQSNGLDQAYVDLTQYLTGKTHEQIQEFMHGIRKKIYDATGLTVSCGVGANKMLAKIASEQRKPNNQFVLPNDEKTIEEFMALKKLRKIPGIGPVNEYYLKGLGLETGKDILQNLDALEICFSRQSCEFFVSRALGLGSIEHEVRERKSVGRSQTFKATQDVDFLKGRLEDLCEQVSHDLQQLGVVSKNVVLTYQSHNFEKRDRSCTVTTYVDQKSQLLQAVMAQFNQIKGKMRLLGVRCSSLINGEDFKKQQLVTFLNNPKKMLKENIEQEKNSVGHVKSLMRNQITQRGKFLCPVCEEQVDCKGNVAAFNRHVDKCLRSKDQVEVEQPVRVEREIQSVKSSEATKGSVAPKKQSKKTAGKAGTLQGFIRKK